MSRISVNPNHFLPKSLIDAPMWYTSSSISRKRSCALLNHIILRLGNCKQACITLGFCLYLQNMAKGFAETDAQCRGIVEDVRKGIFSPVYLLMGEESYYPEIVCRAIVGNVLQDSERDFNQTICYGTDTDADKVITAAMRYPVFASRQLVVVKEAQSMKTLDGLARYCQNPLPTTVLVIYLHGASVDKRKELYKNIRKTGTIVESNPVRDYEMSRWISSFFRGRGLDIAPDAAALLAEFAGTDLAKIAVETDKMLKNLPEGSTSITAADIENNVGISRQYSIFELTRELSLKNASRALKIAAYIGQSPKFVLLLATAPLFTHFYRILRYEALIMKNPSAGNAEKASVLGVNPYFLKEYDTAVANYPPRKCISVISLIKEYDFKGKGGNSGEAAPAELLTELVAKILNT